MPTKFKYVKVKDLDEAFDFLKDGAKPLAGGQSILPMLKLRISKFDYLMDINNLDLRYIKEEDGKLRIGALTTHNEVASIKTLSKVALTIADLQVRNRGTIGGSLANADPSANYYPALLVLDAKIKLSKAKGERILDISDFYESPYQTKIREDELITEIIIDKESLNDEFKFSIFKKGGSAYPNVIVAMKKFKNKDKVRIGIGAVFEKPIVLDLDYDNPEKMANQALSLISLKPLDDVHTRGEMKLKIIKNFIKNMLENNTSDIIEIFERKEKKDSNINPVAFKADEKILAKIKVNGNEIENIVEPRTLLLDFLRANGFKEVKRGCDEGKCGACTVLLNGKAIKSCLTLAVQAIGNDVRTIKGIKADEIKNAFIENFAMQCGYCTHGFLMATYDYLKNTDPKARDETLKYSIKNICRCTGYVNIIKAIKQASSSLLDEN
ncbi:hypothetical protein B6F84_00995 [Acidianus manzaensis]|uniref:Carbon monoxide dehydrogenase n=1 Tax=Acidianus manzaensis TaxID=282676 RepID=A0A1W6K361_9CREN|nr:hypothetical protein B6F84_00995 [Acidianus manzaensis]